MSFFIKLLILIGFIILVANVFRFIGWAIIKLRDFIIDMDIFFVSRFVEDIFVSKGNRKPKEQNIQKDVYDAIYRAQHDTWYDGSNPNGWNEKFKQNNKQ